MSPLAATPDVPAGEVVQALGDLVAAIGMPSFPHRLLDALRLLAGVDLCSAFLREGGDHIELIFACGDLPDVPGFTLRASHDYAQAYWRSDRQMALLAKVPAGAPVVVRRRAADIADPAYRAACYDRAKVIERVSILSPGRSSLMINGYRTAERAPFAAADVERLDVHARLLLAALRQHLCAATPLVDEAGLAGRLCALDCGLSAREAEVVAGMILGETQEGIARMKHISPATVVTYRRRAYGKLGVSNRRDLMALHRRLATGNGRVHIGGEGE
ncbi:helix-turn-helix transcriptional regulator [Sphingobium ummariense]|uniref:HTH luxR-type domain-containing protein n=1 Tax=Sphingobium ummariense RL-3 TaxID=1346791 RepID=T0K1L5_9SPHN|nr:LuxR C-terminal-related transcriptional regulator [Sphingobium ummariense]EQB30449.1 hypothetical protein M529_19035 [Sphingobium ummariense RL-3]